MPPAHFQLRELSSLLELLALTFTDGKLGSVLVPYHLALHYLLGDLSLLLKMEEDKFHHKHHALHVSSKTPD